VKLARLLFLKQNTTFRESAELSLRSVTELFCPFLPAHVPHGGNPSGHGARLGQPFFEVHVFKRA
jgi:hypothetical protein